MSRSQSRQKIYQGEEGERTKVVMQKVRFKSFQANRFLSLPSLNGHLGGGSFQAQFFLIYKETGIDCSSKDWKTQTVRGKSLQINKDVSTKTIPPQ